MAFTKSDVFQLVLSGVFLGQQVKSVFHYGSDVSGSGVASSILVGFRDVILPVLTDIMAEDVVWQSILVKNLVDTANTSFASINVPGERGFEVNNPFASWGFRLVPETAGLRQGAKRFPGVSEVDSVDGYPTGTQAVRLALAATAIASSIGGFLNSYSPALASTLTIPGGVVVEFFPSVISSAFSWLTTQNTRKFNAGE